MRETKTGELQICGHIETGFYPPEQCPGEEVDSDSLLRTKRMIKRS